MNYEHKYIKYKTKYLDLEKKINKQIKLPFIIQCNIASDILLSKYALINEEDFYIIRYNKFFNYIKKHFLDKNLDIIICIQEATINFLKLLDKFLLNSDYGYTKQLYNVCNSKSDLNSDMFLCTIYKKNIFNKNLTNDLTEFYKNKNESEMIFSKSEYIYNICNMRILVIEFKINNNIFVICNCHFPGISDPNNKYYLSSHITRKHTISIINDFLLLKHNTFLLIGDFNDNDIKNLTPDNLIYYEHKNDIKTSFHQLVLTRDNIIIKNYDQQREVLDHVMHTKNININYVSYFPTNGIEKNKQYPYNGMDAYKIKLQNPKAEKNDYVNTFNKILEHYKKNTYENNYNLYWSDHATLVINSNIILP